MGTSYKQDEAFVGTVISKRLLEDSIEWISNNMDPEDVFSEDKLTIWAVDHGYSIGE